MAEVLSPTKPLVKVFQDLIEGEGHPVVLFLLALHSRSPECVQMAYRQLPLEPFASLAHLLSCLFYHYDSQHSIHVLKLLIDKAQADNLQALF
jgi:hypothetical protein